MKYETKKYGSYTKVYDFMLTKLGLAKYELLIYAYFFSFTVNGGCYSGSQETLIKRFGIKSRTTLQSALNNLVERGYIIREYKPIPQGMGCEYTCNMDLVDSLFNF